MTIVVPSPPPELLEERRRKGIDHHDEMWEGALHMPPMPNRDHAELGGDLYTFLKKRLRPRGIKVHLGRNVASPGGWPQDFRVPDLVITGPDRLGRDRNEYLEGGPDVAVEIASPGDETRKKIPFYARIEVTEVWIIDRDTKEIEVLLLRDGAYEPRPPDAAGWVASPFAGIEARPEGGKLLVRMRGDEGSRERIPED
jgi:Uma2 family endonuclease